MKFVLFYHSFVSCWNHGNAHFLRGFARELIQLGHRVVVYEPHDGWSRTNALTEPGAALPDAAELVPGIEHRFYQLNDLDLDRALDHADVVLVHEWNEPDLVARVGGKRLAGANFLLLFHDTHHRAVTAPDEFDRFDLEAYDGVLAFGDVLRDIYQRGGWGRRAYTWHEAADTALFHPSPAERDIDLIWIGNWGDGEREAELVEFLLEPAARLNLRTCIHGVRYPEQVRARLQAAGIAYPGWLPNHLVPEAFARAHMTVHVPRRPYVKALPGIPTIRIFEALACGIPVVTARWQDIEGLFPPGSFLKVATGAEMTAALALLRNDPAVAAELARAGLRAIEARHTCAHRAAELLNICANLDQPARRRDQTTSSERMVNA
ncbi:MAG: glycosyltransferase [Xanthobacteraceae bacterium]|nr:glycosyltransferase [Xanthobacteraceae bacterium]MBV9627773.1 glycosyltransferase [Xanthobacteraceae bacterium]